MDQQLVDLLARDSSASETPVDAPVQKSACSTPAESKPAGTTVRFVDDATGEIEVTDLTHPDSPLRHVLKPMAELYGSGTGRDHIDLTDDLFMPLLLSIEEPVYQLFCQSPQMTDATVTFSLDRLCSSPESSMAGDMLAARIQTNLRLLLSLNNYSRQDVRLGLRKVAKSVGRHTKQSGPRGYLTFLARSFDQMNSPR